MARSFSGSWARGPRTPCSSPRRRSRINHRPIQLVVGEFLVRFDDHRPTFECQLDGGGFSACSSPETHTNLQDGSHTFEVQASDPILRRPPIRRRPPTPGPSTRPAPPRTSPQGPSGTTNQTSVHSSFRRRAPRATSAAATVEASIPAIRPRTHGRRRPALLRASARPTRSANVGPTADRTWTVDTTGSTTNISQGPSGTTNQTSVHIEFSAPGAASYECSRDGGSFNPCNSPEDYTVGDGPHSFDVRATDSLGNLGPTANRNWTVDTTGPTNISAGPPRDHQPDLGPSSFRRRAPRGYECSRDGGSFNPTANSAEDYTVGKARTPSTSARPTRPAT